MLSLLEAKTALHTSAEVLQAIWTKYDPITPPRSRVESKKPPESALFLVFGPILKTYTYGESIFRPVKQRFGSQGFEYVFRKHHGRDAALELDLRRHFCDF